MSTAEIEDPWVCTLEDSDASAGRDRLWRIALCLDAPDPNAPSHYPGWLATGKAIRIEMVSWIEYQEYERWMLGYGMNHWFDDSSSEAEPDE